MFWVNYLNVFRAFKCNKLAVHLKLTLDMIFVVLYKKLNCAADETFDTGHTAIADYNCEL